MSQSVLCVINGLSKIQEPGAVLTANESAAGHEVARIANGRRSALDYWTSTTANAQATITLVLQRAYNFLALDRGHNLAGKQVVWECSSDNFVSTQTMADVVIPAAAGTGHLDDALGVVNEEGAWHKRIPTRTAAYWRIRIPAMGAGLTPRIVGATLGLAIGVDCLMPWDPDASELGFAETVSSRGWRGRRDLHRHRAGVLRIQTSSLFEADNLRYSLSLYDAGRPMWIIPDEAQADRSLLAVHPGGRFGLAQTREFFFPSGELPFVESQALEVA